MKRVLCLVLSLLLVFACVACGKTGTPNPGSATTTAIPSDPEPVPEPESAPSDSESAPEWVPSKNIEFIVPAAAGASLDLHARALNEVLDLGTNLVITNMAGGSQTIGMMELANRPADGYSIGIVAFAGGIIQPQLVDVTYNIDSFRPIAISSGPNSYSICVKQGDVSDWDSFKAVIDSGDTIYWTAPNAGSPAQLAGLFFLKSIGVTNCEFVAYNGAAEALTALLSGDVSFYVTDDSVVSSRQDEGQATGIITLSDKRSAVLPDVICAKEMGVSGMGVFDAVSWILVPKDVPDEVYNYLKEKFDEAVVSDGYQKYLADSKNPEMRLYTEEEMNGLFHSAYDAVAEVIGMLG